MMKISVFCIIASLNICFSLAFIENKKAGGHNLFHSLKDEPEKSSRLENTLPQETSHIHGEPKNDIVDKLGMDLASSNTNNLLSNVDSGIKKSSIYLQPEPRGLQYMLNTGDYNPFLVHYIGKRSYRSKFVGEPYNKRPKKCDGKLIFCTLRNKRQIPLEPGSVIPGSRGQSVLLGVPNGAVPGNIHSTQRFHSSNLDFNVPRGPFQQDYNEGRYVGGYKNFGY